METIRDGELRWFEELSLSKRENMATSSIEPERSQSAFAEQEK